MKATQKHDSVRITNVTFRRVTTNIVAVEKQ
jgi:hypothetical protein